MKFSFSLPVLRIGTGIFQLPIHHPVRVAEQVATIDQISGGRISLGVGMGWWPLEYEVHGSVFAQRGARMEESVVGTGAVADHRRPMPRAVPTGGPPDPADRAAR